MQLNEPGFHTRTKAWLAPRVGLKCRFKILTGGDTIYEGFLDYRRNRGTWVLELFGTTIDCSECLIEDLDLTKISL